MKNTIWTIINTIIFMMNLILTGICALMYAFMRDDTKKYIEHRKKANKYGDLWNYRRKNDE